MANTIDILKNTRVSTNTNEVANANEAQVIKDKPSLFDSLLTNNGNKDTKTTDETKLENKKVETVKTPEQDLASENEKQNKEVVTPKNENKVESSLTEKSNNKIETNTEENTNDKTKSTGSLLDRMIFEVKKDIKLLSEEEVKKINNKIDTQTVSSLELGKIEENSGEEIKSTNSLLNNQPLEVKENIKTSSEEIKSTNSLLDNGLLEIKENTKVSSEEKINNKIEIPSIIDSELAKTKEQVVYNENKIENSLTTESNNKIEINAEENTNDKTKSTGSLLDRMMLEITKDTKISSEEVLSSEQSEIPIIQKNENLLNEEKQVQILVNSKDSEIINKIEENTDLEKNIKNPQEDLIIKINPEIPPEGIIENKKETITPLPNNSTNQNLDTSLQGKIDTTLNVLSDSNSLKNNATISLMDQLILKNSLNQNEITLEETNLTQKDSISKDFISNIYLSSQRSSINTQELFNKNEAINLLKDAKSLNDVKTSAGMLGLDLENIEVEIEQNLEINTKIDLSKKSDMDLLLRKNIINNLMYEKNIINEDVKNLITKSVEASNALIENSLELADDAIVTVNSPLAYNIQSKIIGARQQMSTMMSDIAKQMYENYKPPVTVFKINLNPLELGSIAILMKSDKNNALTISMNVSNNATLEALVENQNVLRNSLNKNFDENTKFNLDFSSSNQNNNQSNNQSGNQKNSNNFEQKMDTQSVLQLKEENKDKEEKSTDYM